MPRDEFDRDDFGLIPVRVGIWGPLLFACLAEGARQERSLAEAHERDRAVLAERLGLAVRSVPQLPRDIHDLEGLEALRRAVFAST